MEKIFSAGPLRLSLENLPHKSAVSASVLKRVEEKYKKWIESDFAGYRRILKSGSDCSPNLAAIRDLAKARRQLGGGVVKNLVVLGTGGSSLGAEALISALHSPFSNPRCYFMDNNDPDFFADHLRHWRPEETLVFAVSKSGSTPETWSQLMLVIPWLQGALGPKWKEHLVFCTDPEKGDFRSFARSENIACLDVPSAVGGRFSVFTAVGLFPTAVLGMKNEEFLAGAQDLIDAWENLPLEENPVFQLASAFVQTPSHRLTVLYSYSSYLRAFGRWFAQLWGESLGKEEKGFTPYSAIGTTDQHSQTQLYIEGPRDKIFGFHSFAESSEELPLIELAGAKDLASTKILAGQSMDSLFRAELKATQDSTTATGLPNFSVVLSGRNERSMGALLFFWEWVTTYTGALLEIDPYTQPGVEKGKILTKKYLKPASAK